MEENPYQVLLGVMGGEAERRSLPFVRTGVVVSVVPLRVQSGALLLDAGDLLIDARLLGRSRAVSVEELSGEADLPSPLGAKTAFQQGKASMMAQLPGELGVGDRVVMVTPDGEQFIILCKGVRVP